MNLQLSLKKKWFEMTKSGVKTEDYREITPYWCARLLLHEGKHQTQDFWFMMPISFCEQTIDFHEKITFKKFHHNVMALGYPKSTDTERILKLEHKGIEIRNGNADWGAETNKLYFVIKHGEIIL